jgi:DNA invertase Pin-like site-specific DNA recombinase
MNAKRIKRVALYVRVSTDHQSVKNQEIELQVVAERHGWQVVSVYRDQGISGAKGRDKRPGLDKLLLAVARKEFDLEDRILFRMAEDLLREDTLVRLGRAWARKRIVPAR